MSNEQDLKDRIDELEQKLKHMDEIDTVDKEQTWVEILVIVWLVVLSGLVFFKDRSGDPHQQAIQKLEERVKWLDGRIDALGEIERAQQKINKLHAEEIIRLEQMLK